MIEPLNLTQDDGEIVVLTARPMSTKEPCLDIHADCCLDKAEVQQLVDYLTSWLDGTVPKPMYRLDDDTEAG